MEEKIINKRKYVKYQNEWILLTHALFKRMTYLYAVSLYLEYKNFSSFLTFEVFQHVKVTKPYGNNEAWFLDCLLKAKKDESLRAFEKTIKLIGKANFQKQLSEVTEQISEKALNRILNR